MINNLNSHLIVDYEIFMELKNPKYNLGQGIREFKIEDELEDAVIFFDENMNYIESERFEFEDIKVNKVLLPRFIWKYNLDKLENFNGLISNKEVKNYSIVDFMKQEENQKEIYKIEDLTPKNYKVLQEPRENQKPIIDFFTNNIKETKTLNGILQAAPGTGKTFMSIYFSQFFKKTLIIVPKNILADQWRDAILQFTDLNPEDVNILEGSNLDKIQDTINNSKILITKPQSLTSQIKRLDINSLISVYSVFDLVLIDECHNFGALGFSKTVSLFSTCNILGLTASPWRRGINEFLLKNSTGEVLFEAEAEVLTPDVFIQKIPLESIPFAESELKYLQMKSFDYIQYLTYFNMFMTKKNEYFSYLKDWVKYLKANNHQTVILFSTNKLASKMGMFLDSKEFYNDKVLVLTGNSKNDALNIAKNENKVLKENLKEFKEELNEKVKNKEIKRKEADLLYKEERIRNKELQEINKEESLILYFKKIKEAKIIISNFGLLREGFDKPELSAVIFGSPIIGKVSVVQTLGRITRLHDDKPKPIALFPVHELFSNNNKQTFKVITNNIKSTYPNADIKII